MQTYVRLMLWSCFAIGEATIFYYATSSHISSRNYPSNATNDYSSSSHLVNRTLQTYTYTKARFPSFTKGVKNVCLFLTKDLRHCSTPEVCLFLLYSINMLYRLLCYTYMICDRICRALICGGSMLLYKYRPAGCSSFCMQSINHMNSFAER